MWVLQHIPQNIFLQSMQIAQIEFSLHNVHLGTHSSLPKTNKKKLIYMKTKIQNVDEP